jgi:GETHR pentapeptide repeat (5 copies)
MLIWDKLIAHPGETHLGETHLGETHLGETHLGEMHLGETHLGATHLEKLIWRTPLVQLHVTEHFLFIGSC